MSILPFGSPMPSMRPRASLRLLLAGIWAVAGMMSCSHTLQEPARPAASESRDPHRVQAAGGTTYYVDSASGSDANAGTASSAPWKSITKLNAVTFQPGDRILLKAGSSWTLATGTEVHPLGSGASGSPIVLDMYGGTTKPILNGCGAPKSNALHLVNQQYWEISNLEITNAGSLSDNTNDQAIKHGVFVEANSGVIHHIHLKNLDVHDVYGYLGQYAGAKDVGGIVLKSKGGATARFDDVLVDGCTVSYVDRQGITVGDIGCNGGLTNYSNTYYSTNVVIQNCTVDHPGGDGIVVFYCEGAVIQHCLTIVTNNKSDYACSIWPWSCTNTHIQYNEGYGAKTVSATELDDGTFADADGENDNTFYDYNYSHDNQGGFAMICDSTSREGQSLPPRNSYFRHNISRNEGAYVVYFSSAQAATNTFFYHNTFYQPAGCRGKVFHADSGTSTFTARNNIFVNLGTGKGFNVTGTHTLDGNVYYGGGFSGDTAEINRDARRLTTDPMLKGVQGATAATRYSDVISQGLFQLQAGSPAIASGTPISGQLAKDFWGNPVSTVAPCRGAHEYGSAQTISVSINPGSASVYTLGTQSFTAQVTGAANPAVLWTATGGSITAAGLYTAPASAGTFTVRATSVEDAGKYDEAVVTVTLAPPITVTISPKATSLTGGSTLQFSATVSGTANTAMKWTCDYGTVSSTGLYKAPVAAGTYHVRATSLADTSRSDLATITVTPGISVAISPKAPSLTAGSSLQFSAAVSGTANGAVKWTCDYGTVSSTGLYKAPVAAGTYHVRATSLADTTRSDLATITVTPGISVTISPRTPVLAPGSTQQFSATVSGTANTAVKWTCDYGTVSSTGLYKAPLAAGTYHVRATSLADATRSDLATLTVGSGTATNIAPSGTGYTWRSNASATSDANRSASPGVNDGNLATSLVLNASGEGGSALWQGAGVVWAGARTLSSVVFINGTDDGYQNGFFQSGFRVQFSLDGTTWMDSSWGVSPAYPYASSAWGKSYAFTGAVQSGVRGVRVLGQTGGASWSGAVIEVQALGF